MNNEPTIEENPVYYNPEKDDKMPNWIKITVCIGIVLIISLIYNI